MQNSLTKFKRRMTAKFYGINTAETAKKQKKSAEVKTSGHNFVAAENPRENPGKNTEANSRPSASPGAKSRSRQKFRETFKQTSIYFVLVLLLIFIFVLSQKKLQARSTVQEASLEKYRELQAELEKEKSINAALSEKNANLSSEFETKRSNMLQAMQGASPEVEAMAQEYQLALQMAGMTKYSGSGIRITLADKKGISYDSSTSFKEIVHDADIRYAVEFFKANYASAIAVNGERVSPMSPLLCTGPSVLVNRIYLSSPFVIEAGFGKTTTDADELNEQNQIMLEVLHKAENDPTFINMKDRGLEFKLEIVEEMNLEPMQDLVYVDTQIEKLGGGNYEEKK